MNLLPLAEKLEADGVGVMTDTIFINMIPVEAPTGVRLPRTIHQDPASLGKRQTQGEAGPVCDTGHDARRRC